MSRKRRYFFFVMAVLLLIITSSMINIATISKKSNKEGIYFHGPRDGNKIALTFDDGPSACTLEVLDELKEYNVNATFFVIGMNALRFQDILKKEFDEGHAIGSHTYSHPDMQIRLPEDVREQLDSTENIIVNITGHKPVIFRPPYGAQNIFIFHEARKRGYTLIEWSASGRDWETKDPGKVAKNVLENTKNGTIILMHDGRRLKREFDCNSTVEAITNIIKNLTAQGYEFVTVPELLDLKK